LQASQGACLKGAPPLLNVVDRPIA
jgi:hypothetical protein